LGPVICHDSYLINVGSPDPALWAKSRKALEEEYRRCTELGIQYLVMHPGAHVGSGEEAAFEKIAAAVEQVLVAVPDSQVEILLENTAGQGSNVGWSFEHLQQIIERIKSRARVGVCFDTCHAFAAGYDLTTQAGWDETWSEFDRLVGLDRLKAFHINDSKKGLGSRVDRHEQIGLGQMGVMPFFLLMNDPRFENLVAAIETEYTDDGRENQQNLAVLRWLHGKSAVPTQAQLEAVRQRA
jgi:deoxyribonuclease-4